MLLTKIFHIADIHFRNYIRHEEYSIVLNRLFEYIENNKDENSIIFLGGDIAHSKNDVSPELIEVIANLLKKCTSLCDTILITGNHDCNLNNPGRLDVLTPIVNSLNLTNLFYWKDTGIYTIEKYPDISWNVFSVFDKPEMWIPIKKMPKGTTKIVLHHGAVHGSKTDLKHDIENQSLKIEKFKGADYVLLGDIHKMQYLNENKTMAYCGSLIQQNFGETLENHGLIEWDLLNKSSKFVEIKNDYGYYTLYVINNNIQNPLPFYPKYLKLKIRHERTDSKKLVQIIKDIQKKVNITELIQEKITKNKYDTVEHRKFELGDIRDIEYQNKILTEYINEKFPELSIEDIDSIRQINREVNSNLYTENSMQRHITWKPIRMEFSNMFSYGTDNVIDFENFKGNVGIFSANASGKSSLLSILSFCIFDKCEKTSKATQILNNTSNEFNVKLEIELKGRRYFIERSGIKNKKSGNVPVIVKFYYVENDILHDLTGQERDDTNKIIREHFGTYEDFVMTTLSSQIGTESFIDRTNKQRKELLYQFLDISIYNNLFEICKNRIKDKQSVLKYIEQNTDFSEPERLKEQQQKENEKQNNILNLIKLNESKIDLLNKGIQTLNQKYVKLNDIRNEKDIQKDIEYCKTLMNKLVNEIEVIETNIKQLQEKHIDISVSELEFYTNYIDDVNILTKQKNTLETKITKLKTTIEIYQKTIKKLDEHEYDPNCQYCIKNPFVQDAQLAKAQINIEQEKYNKLINEVKELNQLIDQSKERQTKYKLIASKINEKNSIESSLEMANLNKENKIQNGKNTKIKYNEFIKELANTKQHLIEIENNNILKEAINNNEKEIKEIKLQNEKLNNEYNSIEAKLINNNIRINDIEQQVIKYQNLKDEIRLYDYFINCVNKDGIPYTILKKVLPVIENEVNSLLQHMVEFQIKFETNDEFYINSYIVYGDDKQWAIEMVSGMERFILTLAIRTALIEITSLPKANFMAIDEGFGVLDNENMSSIYLLYEVLRTKFDFILSVSHTDTMKDIMDNTIRIEKNNGKSRIIIE